nr:UDP-N-acetylmuramate dehydrogenase [Actinomycetota bacterium]
LADTFESLQFVEPGTNSVITMTSADLQFGYRTSALKEGHQGLVVSVTFALHRDTQATPVRYGQLAAALGVEVGDKVAAPDVRAAVLALRASKGMVISDDPDSISVGSFFTNPVVSDDIAQALPPDAPRYASETPRSPVVVPLGAIPEFPAFSENRRTVKLSAAWLIEHSGIPRGFTLPGNNAGISTKHTLAIVNRGHATADDVLELARYITIRVHDEFGVMLTPEPSFIGFD